MPVDDLIDVEAVPSAEEKEPVTQALSKLDQLYDKYKRLVFLFDVSPSMNKGMPLGDYLVIYKWTPELVAKFRDAMYREVLEGLQSMSVHDLAETMAAMSYDHAAVRDHFFYEQFGCSPDDEDSLKMAIGLSELDVKYGIHLPLSGVETEFRSKIKTVREAARKYIVNRTDKYPDSDISIIFFTDDVWWEVKRRATKVKLLACVDNMTTKGGGTHVFKAIEFAVADCEKNPGKMGTNHLVLTTDGETQDTINEDELILRMKSAGITLDYIMISDSLQKPKQHAYIHKICTSSGGAYTEVRTDADLSNKFLNAANRLLLPSKRE